MEYGVQVRNREYEVRSTEYGVQVWSTVYIVQSTEYRIQILDHRETKKWTDRSGLHTRRSLHSIKEHPTVIWKTGGEKRS